MIMLIYIMAFAYAAVSPIILPFTLCFFTSCWVGSCTISFGDLRKSDGFATICCSLILPSNTLWQWHYGTVPCSPHDGRTCSTLHTAESCYIGVDMSRTKFISPWQLVQVMHVMQRTDCPIKHSCSADYRRVCPQPLRLTQVAFHRSCGDTQCCTSRNAATRAAVACGTRCSTTSAGASSSASSSQVSSPHPERPANRCHQQLSIGHSCLPWTLIVQLYI